MKTPILIVALLFAQLACAREPSEIIEKLPHGFSNKAAKLRATLAAPVTDDETVQLAQDYLNEGRATMDVALVNIGASLLEPIAQKTNAPASSLMTLATCKSYSHDFTNALRLLHRASAFPQARLEADIQSISILITLGRFAGAKTLFARNTSLLVEPRGITLLALLSSSTGQLERSYALLRTSQEKWTNSSPAEICWRLGILAEMAERLGRIEVAEQHYRAALNQAVPDYYATTAWLNFLMANNRQQEGLAFIASSPWREKLLLWKAELSPTETDRQTLDQQFQRTTVHLREYAFFLLRVRRRADEALKVALQNWAIQKEAGDLRLVIESAFAANQPQRAREAIAWMRDTKFQDTRLDALISSLSL